MPRLPNPPRAQAPAPGRAREAGRQENGRHRHHARASGAGTRLGQRPQDEAARAAQQAREAYLEQRELHAYLEQNTDLARQLGGDLVLLPQPGPGARFLLTIGIGPAAQAAQPEPPQAPALPPVNRVLVIDDIATNRLVARTYLQMQGIAAVEAASGAEALPILAAGGIDAVLLDLNMPGMDGAATLAAIRALPGAPGRVPVIAMTADASAHPQAAARALGLDGYVTKPVDPEALTRALRHLRPARRQG
ncbi:MAG: response regulator [Rhodobacterales bacterium]|nr:response regulator [Rhodobacterales bacterium]